MPCCATNSRNRVPDHVKRNQGPFVADRTEIPASSCGRSQSRGDIPIVDEISTLSNRNLQGSSQVDAGIARESRTRFVSIFRTVIRQVHLWLGLSAGLILAVVGLSGAGLVFADQMVKSEVPSFFASVGAGEWRPVSEWLSDAEKKYPDLKPIKFVFGPGSIPMPTAVPVLFAKTEHNGDERHTLISVDPVKGIALQRIDAEDTWAGILVIFHKELLADDAGMVIVAIAGIFGIISVISGIYLWWPKPGRWSMAFRFRRGARGIALLYDLHGVPAGWVAIPLLLALVSGLYIEQPRWIDPIVNVASAVRDLPPASARSSAPGSCSKATNVDEAVALAKSGRETKILRHLYLPLGPTGTYDIELRAPDANPRADGDRIYVDANCPRVVAVVASDSFSVGENLKSWMWPLHADLLLGPIGKVLLFFAGLSLPALFATGLLYWLKTRR